jgi:hypothetical protein
MPELAYTGPPAYPPPPRGEVWCTRQDDGSVTIDRADPQILISAELLDMIREGDCDPALTLDGDVLRIEAANRTVIYHIGEKRPDINGYYAEWPD